MRRGRYPWQGGSAPIKLKAMDSPTKGTPLWFGHHRKALLKVVSVLTAIGTLLAVAADLTVDLPQAAPQWLAWLVSALRLLPPASFFYGFLVACGIVLLTILLLARSEKRQQASAVAALPFPVIDPPAPVESVEQLCTFYHCCLAPALRWAIDFLDAGICGSSAMATGDRAMISLLIREQLLPPCREKLERLHDLIVAPVDWTESRFNEAIGNARTLLNGDYRRLAFWISRAGSEILGESNLVAMAGHLELRYRHWELFTEARRIRAPHSRLAGIVPLLTDVERFFSGLARPASTTILQAMSVGELQAHARSEGVAWFIGKRWGTGRLLIVDRQETGPQATLSLACKAEDGYAVILESLDQHNLEKLLRPGKHLAAVGTIKEIIGGRIVLSPVEVVHAESDS